ncbi:MAG: SPOR domain-containing protein [Rhodobacteraceae bacterium]|nr:SPOR domain-containing protein [Paracoccaceae bacterium]
MTAGGASAMMGWLGALTSVALMGGLGYWVYDLATRDAHATPVVRAMVGPSRTAPDEPGGFEAAHQGYAVNNLASDEHDLPLAERVVLAPEEVGPTEEDQAPGMPVDPLASMRDAVEGALSEVLGLDAESGRAAPVGLGGARGAHLPAGPRPVQRPDRDVVTRATLSPATFMVPVHEPLIVEPSDIPDGARLVQLGDYASPDEAEAAWARLGMQFSDFLDSKARVIAPVQSGGQQRYRLRAYGFEDLAEARNLCAALIAEQADCIPVRM